MRKNRLFGQTVTLYHGDAAAKTVTRTVLQGVYLQKGRRELPDAAGARGGDSVLVVIPQSAARWGVDYTLAPNDRLCAGEGPALDWEAFAAFVPGADPAAAVVQYVLPLTLAGQPHHVEAGAWWQAGGTGAHSLTR